MKYSKICDPIPNDLHLKLFSLLWMKYDPIIDYQLHAFHDIFYGLPVVEYLCNVSIQNKRPWKWAMIWEYFRFNIYVMSWHNHMQILAIVIFSLLIGHYFLETIFIENGSFRFIINIRLQQCRAKYSQLLIKTIFQILFLRTCLIWL